MRGRGESTAGIAEFTRDALERGATLLAGGTRIGDSGNFWQPTVLADVPLDARIFNDEPFGPMAGIRTFDTLDEAIAEANRLPYGLAATAVDRGRCPTLLASGPRRVAARERRMIQVVRDIRRER